MTGFRDFLPGFRHRTPEFDAALEPDEPFVAIGDIHGRDDLFIALMGRIREATPDVPVILVGDYIDRGPESASVLRRVIALSQRDGANVICLKGNHEAMFLEFIETPAELGPRWLANGGDRTLQSFGVTPPVDPSDQDQMLASRDALLTAAGEDLVRHVRNLPLSWQSGNVVVTHAGADPSNPIEPRRGHGLLWGHRDFLRKERQDGLWVVHGHYIVAEPSSHAGRIAIDTGAYASGCLTAAVIEPGSVRFLGT